MRPSVPGGTRLRGHKSISWGQSPWGIALGLAALSVVLVAWGLLVYRPVDRAGSNIEWLGASPGFSAPSAAADEFDEDGGEHELVIASIHMFSSPAPFSIP